MIAAARSALWLILAGFPTSLIAAIADPLEAAGCTPALTAHFGGGATFKLINRRNSRHGLLFKVAIKRASPSSGNWEVRYCTCLVQRGGRGKVIIEEVYPASND